MSENSIVAAPPRAMGALASQESSRAVAEAQSAMLIAKNYPRDEISAERKILAACKRPRLAEVASYSYARGGTPIEGPTIRLAEALAQNWGNLEYGVIELERSDSESTMMAYCIDLETNTRQRRVFNVPHERHSRNGVTKISDPRDIYENNANYAARRLRACILGIVPQSVVELAMEQCDKTLSSRTDVPLVDRIEKMLIAFQSFGVTKEMIETKFQHNVASMTERELVQLGKIYNAIKDGFLRPEEHFAAVVTPRAAEKNAANDAIDSAPIAAKVVEPEIKDVEATKDSTAEEKAAAMLDEKLKAKRSGK